MYTIVMNITAKDLTDNVNNLLKLGWKLQGGVSLTAQSGRLPVIIYAQALIKE